MGFNFEGLVYVHNIYFKWGKISKMFWIIIDIYSKMTLYFKHTSYLCEISHDVCYQHSIRNNLFISVINNKGKIEYI